MKQILTKIVFLTASFLFFSQSTIKAAEDFNLNSITAKDIKSIKPLEQKGIFRDLFKPKTKEWTVMVFINSKNNLSANHKNGPTIEYAKKDIAEMKKIGTTKAVNVIVEYGTIKKKTKRMLIRKDWALGKTEDYVLKKTKNADMGDYKEVIDFVKWSKTKFPAKKYMLVLWNHGSGWLDPKSGNNTLDTDTRKGILFDDETKNYVKTLELGEIFKETGYIDILMMNACLMQMAEVAYEIKDNIGLLIGSEEVMLATGMDYEKLLRFINANTAFTNSQLSNFLLNWYHLVYAGKTNQGLTLSTIRPQAMNKLPEHLNNFANAVMKNTETEAVKHAIKNVIRFSSISPKDKEKNLASYADLYDFAKLISEKANSNETGKAARALMRFIKYKLVLGSVGVNKDPVNGYDYSKVGGIAIEMTRKIKKNVSHGLSTFFTTKYSDLSLSKESLWDEFIDWTNKVWLQ